MNRAACERENTTCSAVKRARWHCYRWPSKAGGFGGTECFVQQLARVSSVNDRRVDSHVSSDELPECDGRRA